MPREGTKNSFDNDRCADLSKLGPYEEISSEPVAGEVVKGNSVMQIGGPPSRLLLNAGSKSSVDASPKSPPGVPKGECRSNNRRVLAACYHHARQPGGISYLVGQNLGDNCECLGLICVPCTQVRVELAGMVAKGLTKGRVEASAFISDDGDFNGITGFEQVDVWSKFRRPWADADDFDLTGTVQSEILLADRSQRPRHPGRCQVQCRHRYAELHLAILSLSIGVWRPLNAIRQGYET